MLRAVKSVDAESNFLIADELEMRVDAFGSNVAFIEGDRQWTYDDMETYANRVAAWAKLQGLKQGDCVAVFARNRLEYIPLWFGLTKLGIIPALLKWASYEDVHIRHDWITKSRESHPCPGAKLYAWYRNGCKVQGE